MALLQAVGIGLIALLVTPGFFFYFDITPKLIVLLALAAVIGAGPRPPRRTLFTAILLFTWYLSAQAHRVLPMLRVISVAGAITAIYGIAQYFGFDPILPSAA